MFRTSQTKDISLYVPIKIILKLALSNKNRILFGEISSGLSTLL
jgi:hypothetical protein